MLVRYILEVLIQNPQIILILLFLLLHIVILIHRFPHPPVLFIFPSIHRLPRFLRHLLLLLVLLSHPLPIPSGPPQPPLNNILLLPLHLVLDDLAHRIEKIGDGLPRGLADWVAHPFYVVLAAFGGVTAFDDALHTVEILFLGFSGH